METLEQELLTPTAPEEAIPEEAAVQKKPERTAPAMKKREWNLLPVLAVLLIILGVGELAFWAFAGFSVYRDSLEKKQQAEQTPVIMPPGSPAQTAASGSGTGGGTAQTGSSPSNGEKRLSSLSVPRIPYDLAEMEVPPGTDPSLPRLSTLSVPRIPYDLAEMDETP